MAIWLLVIILAYFFFSLSSFGDKLILSGEPKPKAYTFYAGLMMGLAVLFFIPFMELRLPTRDVVPLIILDAIVYLTALYAMFSAVKKFEVSRVVTTIGAVQPIFILILTWFFWSGQLMTRNNIFAFVLLLLGNIVISFEKNFKRANGYFKITLFSAFLFSLDYVLMKAVFLTEPFLLGFFWMRIIGMMLAFLLILKRETRQEVFSKQTFLNKKIISLMTFTYTCSGIANMLQAFAVFLAPIAMLAIINSLRGLQYIFLFLITLFFSLFLPKVLKEEISTEIVFQKAIAIAFIAGGLAMLVY
jgi:drug/metabolite transporter (DMT)-like permease